MIISVLHCLCMSSKQTVENTETFLLLLINSSGQNTRQNRKFILIKTLQVIVYLIFVKTWKYIEHKWLQNSLIDTRFQNNKNRVVKNRYFLVKCRDASSIKSHSLLWSARMFYNTSDCHRNIVWSNSIQDKF